MDNPWSILSIYKNEVYRNDNDKTHDIITNNKLRRIIWRNIFIVEDVCTVALVAAAED